MDLQFIFGMVVPGLASAVGLLAMWLIRGLESRVTLNESRLRQIEMGGEVKADADKARDALRKEVENLQVLTEREFAALRKENHDRRAEILDDVKVFRAETRARLDNVTLATTSKLDTIAGQVAALNALMGLLLKDKTL